MPNNLPVVAYTLPISIIPKSGVEDMVSDVVASILESTDAMSAYVLAKQFELAGKTMVAMLRQRADIAYNGDVKIGAASVTWKKVRPEPVWKFDDDTQSKINQNNEIIAGLMAQNEELSKQSIEQGLAKKVSEIPSNRGGLTVTFDK